MSNIEKIRQEIEFLKDLNEGLYTEGDNSYYEGQDNAYNHILAFIDSLPEEDDNKKLKDAEVIFNGWGLKTDVTKWADGYKLKIKIYDED